MLHNVKNVKGDENLKNIVMCSVFIVLSGCSTPSDVANSPTLANFSARGDIDSAIYCVRKKKESLGTIVNSVMSIDLFPTPSGEELHLYAQGDHRITSAIAYYSANPDGYAVEVKATGAQWGEELVKWVRSCAKPI